MLWASVLLNIARGGRHKPGVVAQRGRAGWPITLPRPTACCRSWRLRCGRCAGRNSAAGLAGVVRLVEAKPELVPVIRQRFPELEL